MQVITVSPIAKGIFREHLSYFCTFPAAVGSIVTIPVRGKILDALVIDAEPAAKIKSSLKNSDFALKKALALKKEALFLPEFIAACRETADFYCSNLGQVIKTVLPQAILDRLSLSKIPATDRIEPEEDGTLKQNKFILQELPGERLSFYKAAIRESFAKKESVFFLLPSAALVERASRDLGPGISNYTIVLHGNLNRKQVHQNWAKALKSEHPILVIATPNFLSLPRPDIRTFIVEQENNSAYRTLNRPYLDFRFLAERLATNLGARIIFGDLVMRSETIFRTERGELAHLSGVKYRSVSNADQFIFSAKNEDPAEKNVTAIADPLRRQLELMIAEREKILVYCGRRGHIPATICSDCGELVRCAYCKSPLTLHKNSAQKKYFYLCHKCGRDSVVSDLCSSCGSWRLVLLGIGLEKAYDELAALFPDTPLFRVDSDSVPPKKRREIVEKFYGTRGQAILLSTEAANAWLSDPIANVAVIALDSAFSVPDFRVSEKVLNTLFDLRSLAVKKFIIQTRNPEEKVYRYAAEGNLIDFYREEIEERMKLGYPPFKVLIKLGPKEAEPSVLKRELGELSELLADYSPLIYPAAEPGKNGKIKGALILKLPAQSWPDPELSRKLRGIDLSWPLEIEPESIL